MARVDANNPTVLRALIGDKNFRKMGNYKMATGGGDPLPKGEKLKDHPEAHRVDQPRDEDGKFTYNSANFMELKSGKSRGTTIPPMIRDRIPEYAIKVMSGINYRNAIWKANINMSIKEYIEQVKYYSEETGFGKLSQTVNKKRGRRSFAERYALKKRKQGYVNPYLRG